MRFASAVLMFALAACGKGNDAAAPDYRGEAVQTADLTGLYQGHGSGERRARMCMVARPSGITSFGIVAWSPGGGTCGGAGEVTRRGSALRLAMTGDEKCVIDARMNGRRVTFAASVPEGCAYYCGPAATLAGQTFKKTGGTAEAVDRARDLVGDPLCS